MKLNSNVQICMLCLLIIGIGVKTTYSNNKILNKQPAFGKIQSQIKKTPVGMITVQLLTPLTDNENKGSADVYNIRIILKSVGPMKKALMPYMNFGIRYSISVLEGIDTLSCIACERIPGIASNEFLYATIFNKPPKILSDTKLRVCITDTIAGFGTTSFDIGVLR